MIAGSGDCPVRPPDVPNKANERSDSSGRPRGGVAIARHHLAGSVRADDIKATAFSVRRTSRSVRIFRSVEREILRRTVAATGMLATTMRSRFGRTISRRLRFPVGRTSRSVRIFRSVETEILRRIVAATGMLATIMRSRFGRTISRRLRSQARGTSRSVRIFRSVETEILRRTVAATGMVATTMRVSVRADDIKAPAFSGQRDEPLRLDLKVGRDAQLLRDSRRYPVFPALAEAPPAL
jgi:precorrin isomerase